MAVDTALPSPSFFHFCLNYNIHCFVFYEGLLFSVNMSPLHLHCVPEKMSFSEKGSYSLKGVFFWDTLYLGKLVRTLESLIYLLVIPDNKPESVENKLMVFNKKITLLEKAKLAYS